VRCSRSGSRADVGNPKTCLPRCGIHATRPIDRAAHVNYSSMARSLCAVTAAALGVQAIDGVYLDFRDVEGLKRDIRARGGTGSYGQVAIHPTRLRPSMTPSFRARLGGVGAANRRCVSESPAAVL